MKVLLVNGSPHENGCTFTALSEVSSVLKAEGIETELVQIGKEPISGCHACGACVKLERCYMDDKVNEFILKAREADAFIFGSPVHFASASGSLIAFMDRVFYNGMRRFFAGKPASAVVSCRRGGASATFDQLNKYFTISGMPVVSSQYWNSVHGNTPDEVRQDLEGLQTMRTLGKNMAWLLKCIKKGKDAGIAFPEREKWQRTNFIR